MPKYLALLFLYLYRFSHRDLSINVLNFAVTMKDFLFFFLFWRKIFRFSSIHFLIRKTAKCSGAGYRQQCRTALGVHNPIRVFIVGIRYTRIRRARSIYERKCSSRNWYLHSKYEIRVNIQPYVQGKARQSGKRL